MAEIAKPVRRTMRFTDEELELIKGTFAENETLLKALRCLFLQLPLTASHKESLKVLKGKSDIVLVVRKSFLPELDPDAPFNQLIDLWMTVDFKEKDPEIAGLLFKSRNDLILAIEERLKTLEKQDFSGKFKIDFNALSDIEGKSNEQIYIDFMTRNFLINHVEMQLVQINNLAGLKKETVDETKNRLAKDSSK